MFAVRGARALAAEKQDAGFTLIEALASLAVMAAILWSVGLMVSQWIPTWSRALVDAQRADLLDLGLDSIARDVAAAEYVSAGGDSQTPLFDGSPQSLTFVRTAYGPGAGAGLEIVGIAVRSDEAGVRVVREQAPFQPSRPGAPTIALEDPIVLVSDPFRLSFAYLGADRVWRESWHGAKDLPRAVRVTVRDALDARVLAASTAFTLHVTAPEPTPEAKDGANAPKSGSVQK